ncbi:MAG: aminotransferase class III-fold pyridoxal phosphate-dependent enzyme [Deltaproteobacteria bacterium]|jgi:glutamate-1-semialdehyde aminotransferase|nr:aminotransferase class III-fold pyridoxal phosphate-dependent enzyme [Deltaproteobacteria bacterium]
MDLSRSEKLYERARNVIPGGIPGIRAPENYVLGAYPILLESGEGGRVVDVDGNAFVDLLLGYGPIILGHGEASVDRAAAARARDGFCLNLPEPIMIELAEKLVELLPSAEQALFFKTGSDATSAAVRIARAHTGRSLVLRCGYHGWHDWCLEADPGVPAPEPPQVLAFPYNDLDRLASLLNHHAGEVAAIILTPIGHDFDRQIEPPAEGYLEGARRLADEHEVVLIFDEVRTGFRVHLGGAQALYGVTPDLTALGKAMANGYPITALVGRESVMQSARSTFISSTYFGNGMDMAAALETLSLLERENVLETVQSLGESLQGGLQELIDETGIPVTQSPYPQMPFLHFDPALDEGQDERRDRFYAALARSGVFAHPRHHGFLCWRHSKADMDDVLEACRKAAREL